MRTLMLAATAALMLAGAASAAPSSGPYRLDARGQCRAADGHAAKQSLCSTRVAAATHTRWFGDPGAVTTWDRLPGGLPIER